MRPVGNLACGDSSHGRLGAPAVRLTPGAMSIWRGAPPNNPTREAGTPRAAPPTDPSRETGSPLPAPSQGAHRVQSQSSPCRVGHRVTRGHCFCLRAGGPFFPRAGGLQRGHCPFDFGHEKRGSRRGEKPRSEEHTSELQSRGNLVSRLLLKKKKMKLRTDYLNMILFRNN